MSRAKYDGSRFRFGTDGEGRPVVYTPSELIATTAPGIAIADVTSQLNLGFFGTTDVDPGFRIMEDLGDDWVRIKDADGGDFDPVDAIERLKGLGITSNAGYFVQPNHVYFMDSIGGSASFAPNQFAPNQFAPNQFAPNQFAPNQFAPNQFAPNQFAQLMGGAAGACCECPQAPGYEDEPPFVPELTARRAYGPPPPVPNPAGNLASVEIHVMDVRQVIDPAANVTAEQAAYEKAVRNGGEQALLDTLDKVPGAILQLAEDVKASAASPQKAVFAAFATEPTTTGRGTNTNNDSYVDPVCGHSEFIEGIIGRIVDPRRITSHAIAGTLGDITDTELRAALKVVHRNHRPNRQTQRRILSLSLSGYNVDDRPGEFLKQQIATMSAGGWLIVASAGNNASCRLAWPAALPGVVAVGAYGPCGPAWFSNYGPWVDAAAPGVGIISDYPNLQNLDPRGPNNSKLRVSDNYMAEEFDTGYASWSGTSFAAPFVAGQLAAWMINNSVGVDDRAAVYSEALDQVIREPSLTRWPNYGTVVEYRREING